MSEGTVIPERPWAHMTDADLARELQTLPPTDFTKRVLRALDGLAEIEALLTNVRRALGP